PPAQQLAHTPRAARPTATAQPRRAAPPGIGEPAHPAPEPGVSPSGSSPGAWLWALLPALSVGFLTFVPFASAAARLRDRRLGWAAVAYFIISLTFWVLAIMSGSRNWPHGVTAIFYVLLAVVVVVATAHARRLRRRAFGPPSAGAARPRS